MDEKLITEARTKLYSGVVSDVLDGLGDMHHALAPKIRPLDDSLVLFGRARTALYMPVYHVEPGSNPYELEIALVDSLTQDDIAVMACPREERIGPWGELLTTAARARGAAGCVTDGLVRDVRLIRELRFPVFSGGIGPLDSKGRGVVMAVDVPVECGGVPIRPGDWIFGDVDGVVIIPAGIAERAVELSLEKVVAENTVREELAAGEKLAVVFARHGIL
ncbi:MAG: RraA family protein [Rhizobiales bacterium]|nr:RraA family protein [Hyphomicrobiales bacterium]